MPLYTYVTVHKGVSYVAQGRRSNFQGFSDWMEGLPAALQKDIGNPYAGFEPVPNRQHVWRKTLMVDGSELVVIAIKTEG